VVPVIELGMVGLPGGGVAGAIGKGNSGASD
jgi:hypothetical protein